MRKKITIADIALYTIFTILALMCIYPILLVIGISFSDESAISTYGYQMIPKIPSLGAYEYIISSKDTILRSYCVTIFNTVVGTVMSVLCVLMYAYPLSRHDVKYRRFFLFLSFFTMLFSGGLVATYMINTNLLHLKNTVWSMILPYVFSAWNVILMRSFLQSSIPPAIIESAKIDGAGEFLILFKLVVPLAVPGIATIALFSTLQYWNDWWLPLLYINEKQLYNLQFLLQSMITKIQELSENSALMNSVALMSDVPKEGSRMALCIIATGPILIVYPFFQKYFIQGLTVGAVKG